jgi:hypothetical protein
MENGEPPGTTSAPESQTEIPVVVALVDTGINPYHEAFRAQPGRGSEAFAERLGAEVITLAQEGELTGRLGLDADVWKRLQPGKLYAFSGTRVLGISISKSTEDAPIFDAIGHGTATASMVAREAPEALIVMVQVDTRGCPPDCPPRIPLAPALEWIASTPSIDIVSMSVGYPGNTPQPPLVNDDVAPALSASRKVSESGKLLVAAAGNTVVPSMHVYVEGPPWVIAVGGAQPKPRGEAALASRGIDVVANYTDWTADGASISDMKWSSGTSYAAPIVAGTLAHALGMLRLRDSRVDESSMALRNALNATATPFTAAEWKPGEMPTNDTLANLAGTNLPILFPPAQQGWGYLDGGMATEIARRVLENDLTPPPEKAQTAAYMAQWQSLREQYWNNAP